jgi:hypothetical protein
MARRAEALFSPTRRRRGRRRGVGDDHRNQQVLERDIAADLTGNEPGKAWSRSVIPRMTLQ